LLIAFAINSFHVGVSKSPAIPLSERVTLKAIPHSSPLFYQGGFEALQDGKKLLTNEPLAKLTI
jgi:hypothetical protein